jgi:hypothetical protein
MELALFASEMSDVENVVDLAAVSSSVTKPPRELDPFVVKSTLLVSEAAVTSLERVPELLKAQASSVHLPGVVPTVTEKS